MKVLFLFVDLESDTEFVANLGVEYLSAVARRRGWETALAHFPHRFPDDEELHATIRREQPDLIAASSVTNMWPLTRRALTAFRRVTDAPIIVGGYHATLVPDEVMAADAVTALVRGEGEEPFDQILQRRESGRDLAGIAGVWHRGPGAALIKEPAGSVVENIESLPPSDTAIFDHTLGGPATRRNLGVMAGRGCPFHCIYCCNTSYYQLHGIEHIRARLRSPEHVVRELEAKLATYRAVERILFHDETFTYPIAWLRDFADRYRPRIGKPFVICLLPNTATPERMELLARAGCEMVSMGIDSGSEWLRRTVLKRPVSDAQIRGAFRRADEVGIKTLAFAMIGFPYETPQMARQTLDLVREVRPNMVGLSMVYPFPGTDIYDICVREGWLVEGIPQSFRERCYVDQPGFPAAAVKKMWDEFFAETTRIGSAKTHGGDFDLVAHFHEARVQAQFPQLVKRCRFKQDFDRYWLFAHPRADITYTVIIDSDTELRFRYGMDPDTYDQPGGGVRFQVLEDRHALFDDSLDPKRQPSDRGWKAGMVRLRPTRNRRRRLTLRTQPLVEGQTEFCAAGWWGAGLYFRAASDEHRGAGLGAIDAGSTPNSTSDGVTPIISKREC